MAPPSTPNPSSVVVGDASNSGRASDAPIPFAPPDIEDGDVAAVAAVLRSGWLTTGDQCAGFEEDLAAYLGVPHVVAMASCTAALETSFAYLQLPRGARVGVPTWTFVASALAPWRYGATPVLLDVEHDTLNLSPAALARALEEGLDALVAVHFGGVPVDASVHELCAAAGVPVVEDAAHALGATDRRRLVNGAGSVAACFSFYATKNLTAGEGGALVTSDATLARFALSYRLHGLSADAWRRYRPGGNAGYDLVAPGIKANLPDVLAALARSQLGRFDAMQSRRRALVERYRERLDGTELDIVPPIPVEGSANHLMTVVLPEGMDRENVMRALGCAGIGTSVLFQPLHRFAWFQEHAAVGPDGVGVADALADRVLNLPLSSALALSAVDRVCDELTAALSA